VVLNLTPVPRANYRIGVPRPAAGARALNTDALELGGSGQDNGGSVTAHPVARTADPSRSTSRYHRSRR
jgi:1,4-alpha-glucan branching enzyme